MAAFEPCCQGLPAARAGYLPSLPTMTRVAATAAVIKILFHMVCSFLRNSESVLGPHGVAHCAYFSRLFNQSTNTSTSFGCGGINMVCPFILRSKTLAALANMGC